MSKFTSVENLAKNIFNFSIECYIAAGDSLIGGYQAQASKDYLCSLTCSIIQRMKRVQRKLGVLTPMEKHLLYLAA